MTTPTLNIALVVAVKASYLVQWLTWLRVKLAGWMSGLPAHLVATNQSVGCVLAIRAEFKIEVGYFNLARWLFVDGGGGVVEVFRASSGLSLH